MSSALVQCKEIFLREIAALSECCINSRAGMAFGADEPVPALHLGIVGINVHSVEIENGEILNY